MFGNKSAQPFDMESARCCCLQCQNIAFGTCQNRAREAARLRGGCLFAFNGFNQCNRCGSTAKSLLEFAHILCYNMACLRYSIHAAVQQE
jgi:hypothetical protein